jgi:chorismate mutase
LEDSITFYLIERVQFPLNPGIYKAGAVTIPNSNLSFLDWTLREREKSDSLIRRFESPDEYPFFPDALQPPILKPLHYPKILHKNDVNVNEQIKKHYIEKFLPVGCADFGRKDRGETEENYGSAATADILCLQALSRRIHFGKCVAVEKKVLERLGLKARTYGTDPSIGAEQIGKINAEAVVEMYRDFVIPLTKEVEVEYLMQRLLPG